MNEEFIKDFNGIIIGIIQHEPNGDKIAKNFPARQILGYYKKSQNVTTDFYGRILTQGDTVISLIFNSGC